MRLLTAVGCALLAAGIGLGFVPAMSEGARCGSPFAPAGVVLRGDGCTDRLSGQRTPALTLVLLGGTLCAAAFGVHATDRSGAKQT